jgi:hypothetical protein
MTEPLPPTDWNDERCALLREHYAMMPWPELIALLGTTRRRIYARAYVMGLVRIVNNTRLDKQKFNMSGPRIIKDTSAATARPATRDFREGLPYTCPELLPYQGRPGAMDAYALPSRTSNKRIYRDGREETTIEATP